MRNLSELIRWLRREKHLSQAALSVKTGLSQQYISRLEANYIELPRLDTLQLIAEALDCDVSILAEAAGIKYTSTNEDITTLLNKALLIATEESKGKFPVIEDIRTEKTGIEHVYFPGDWVKDKEKLRAAKVKKEWHIESQITDKYAIVQGDILLVDKSEKPHKHSGATIHYNNDVVMVTLHKGEVNGLAYYGTVAGLYRKF